MSAYFKERVEAKITGLDKMKCLRFQGIRRSLVVHSSHIIVIRVMLESQLRSDLGVC